MENSKFKIQNWAVLICIVYISFLTLGCGVPNLESMQCAEARDAIRQFYSFHFANDMTPSSENLKARERFLTPELYSQLQNSALGNTDYFTNSDDYPRTFKVGKCEHKPDSSIVNVQIQLYWRDDFSTVQKEVTVTSILKDNWLIYNVLEVR